MVGTRIIVKGKSNKELARALDANFRTSDGEQRYIIADPIEFNNEKAIFHFKNTTWCVEYNRKDYCARVYGDPRQIPAAIRSVEQITGLSLEDIGLEGGIL